MNELISVIIPVYNVEDYLKECLDSLLGQTYSQLEIILVDDGSQDRCPEICDAYAEQDTRIKVIHQPNKGLSEARNVGMRAATGQYWSFIDSDDVVCADFIKSLYYACVEEDAELAMCSFYTCRDQIPEYTNQWYCQSGYEMSRALYQDATGLFGVVCNKMFRRELFEGIEFPRDRIHEDEFVTYRLFWRAQKCAVSRNPFYFYRQRLNSITHSEFSRRDLDAARAYQEKIQFYSDNCVEDLKALAEAGYCHFLKKNMLYISALKMDEVYWKKEMHEAYQHVFNSKFVPWRKKLALTTLMISPKLYQCTKGGYEWMCRRLSV